MKKWIIQVFTGMINREHRQRRQRAIPNLAQRNKTLNHKAGASRVPRAILAMRVSLASVQIWKLKGNKINRAMEETAVIHSAALKQSSSI